MTEKINLFIRIYFLVGAVVGLVGSLISFGMVGTSLIQKAIISDAEYIANSMFYEIKACEQSTYMPKADGVQQEQKKTASEIETCKKETETRLVSQRSYQLKTDSISGLVRGLLFLTVFLTHLPWLRKQYSETSSR